MVTDRNDTLDFFLRSCHRQETIRLPPVSSKTTCCVTKDFRVYIEYSLFKVKAFYKYEMDGFFFIKYSSRLPFVRCTNWCIYICRISLAETKIIDDIFTTPIESTFSLFVNNLFFRYDQVGSSHIRFSSLNSNIH